MLTVFSLGFLFFAAMALLLGRHAHPVFGAFVFIIFGSVGAASGLMVWKVCAENKRLAAASRSHPAEPWLWREEWTSGIIPYNPWPAVLLSLWFTAFVCTFVWGVTFLFVTTDQPARQPVLILMILFPLWLFTVDITYKATIAFLSAKRWGQSELCLAQMPIVDQVNGVVRCAKLVGPHQDYLLTLSCIQRRDYRSKHKSPFGGERIVGDVQYFDESVFEECLLTTAIQTSASGAVVPVHFDLPAGALPSSVDDAGIGTARWILKVESPNGYRAEFTLPVFPRAEQSVGLEFPQLKDAWRTEDISEVIERAGGELLSKTNNALYIRFPKRGLSSHSRTQLIFALAFVIAAIGVYFSESQFGASFLIIGILCLIALLVPLLQRVTLEATQQGMRCTIAGFGWYKTFALAPSEISTIEAKQHPHGQWGSFVECVVITSTTGKQRVLMGNLPSRYLGRRVAECLREYCLREKEANK